VASAGRPLLAASIATSIATWLAGCSADTLAIIVDPPDGVDWIAVVLEGGSGETLGSTGIVPFARMAPIRGLHQRSGDEVAHVRVAAWSDAAVADIKARAGSSLETARLQPARDVDPILPAPTWTGSGTVAGGRAIVTLDDRPLLLTAPYLPPCPTLLPEGKQTFVDVDCAYRYRKSMFVQGGCTIESNSTTLDLGFIDATVDARGRITGADGANCTGRDPPPEAAFSITCGNCDADVYVEPDAPRFKADPPIAVLTGVPSYSANPNGLRSGYLTSIALLSPGSCSPQERIAVVSHDGRIAGDPTTIPPSPLPTHVVLFDPTSGARIDTIATAPNLLRIVPFGDGGFAGLTSGDAASVFTTDCRGRTIATTEIDAVRRIATALGRAGAPERLVVGMSARTASTGALVLAFDDSLRLTATTTVPHPIKGYPDIHEEIYAFAENGPDTVATGTDPEGITCIASIGGGGAVCAQAAMGAPVGGSSFAIAVFSDLIVGPTSADQPAVNVMNGHNALWIGAGAFFEMHARPTFVLPVPPRPSEKAPRAVISVLDDQDRTRVAFFDYDRIRFLPGSTDIGAGIASDAVRDSSGALWFLLPWSAAITRVVTIDE
jgi:hypothetical protein